MKTSPTMIIAGTHSGCGKTTVTLGLMAALQNRGFRVQPFKCGPDFIDPTLHQLVTGRTSRNLDIRMCGEAFVLETFSRHVQSADCGIIEGVMGLFDGGKGSAATLAEYLGIPVILAVDVRSAAESIAAVIHGFTSLEPNVTVAGVICNRIGTDRHRQMIAEAVQKYCKVPVLGYLPRNEEITIPSRHLGLHMGEENPLNQGGLQQLVAMMETHVDLDALLHLTSVIKPKTSTLEQGLTTSPSSVRIGIARDEAFCFYYEDNLDMLVRAGAELVFFSPMHDAGLPKNIQGLYLGGGYPELYAEQLSKNRVMRHDVLAFCTQGKPVYGECGGFMYLTRSITDQEQHTFPMTGVFPFKAVLQPRLRRLGYRQIHLQNNTILGPKESVLHGHEFHYSMIGDAATASCSYLLDDGRNEGYTYKNTLAGYMHLHWGRTPETAVHFVQSCRQPQPY